jgi:hypothetical protein
LQLLATVHGTKGAYPGTNVLGTEESIARSTLGTEGIPATSDQDSRSVKPGAKGRG